MKRFVKNEKGITLIALIITANGLNAFTDDQKSLIITQTLWSE